MTNETKHEPIEQPGPYEPLREALDKGLDDKGVRDGLSIELRISGGMPSQAYFFHFRAAGSGAVRNELRSDREGVVKEAVLDDTEMRRLLQAIRANRILDLPQEEPRFLPDTVVGRLEISVGDMTHRLYFAADEEQAKVQNKVPRPGLVNMVNTIYEFSSQMLDRPSVKP